MSIHTTMYVSEAKDIRPRIEEYVSRIDGYNGGTKVVIINVVGWGSRMNDKDAFLHLKLYMDERKTKEVDSFFVLLWHGDYLNEGSITKAMAQYKDTYPDTLLVAVRGPPPIVDSPHDKFFKSWEKYSIVLVEVSESHRDDGQEQVIQYCPNLSKPEYLKMGVMVHEHAKCDFVFALGGGDTTYGEMQVCNSFRNPPPSLAKIETPSWTVVKIGRKKNDTSNEMDFPNENMYKLCERVVE